jgi:hypothetical protein
MIKCGEEGGGVWGREGGGYMYIKQMKKMMGRVVGGVGKEDCYLYQNTHL